MYAKTFSMDEQKRNIYNHKTREYFDEVYKSYTNGCYRSATVMLWSVVVCDIIYKLQELKELYSDKSATTILSEVEKKQKSDPYSSKWEQDLIKDVFEKTNLLDTASHHKISTIQTRRHLCAHPVISDDGALFHPTEDMVRSDIRNSIETLLSKPPFFSQKVIDSLLMDLEDNCDIFLKDKELKRYLDAKYFNSFTSEVTSKVFRSLWKIVFKAEDNKCDDNRDINYRCLCILYDENAELLRGNIKKEIAYYSNISKEKDVIYNLITFLSTKKDIYLSLNNAAQETIDYFVGKYLSIRSIAFFKSETVVEHIDSTINYINENLKFKYGVSGAFIVRDDLKIISGICEEMGLERKYRELGVCAYINSGDFQRADLYYSRFIKNDLNDYEEDLFSTLIEGANENSQVYGRKKSQVDDLHILQVFKERYPNSFELDKFTNLPIDRIGDFSAENTVEDDESLEGSEI
ncbi:TPA: hypothetical protein SLP25_005060 [Serratia marcescens]|nr:hypothetical protein [Serratia marcescens]HEJ1076277.1 hypothetical protein [Serratia marcescens]